MNFKFILILIIQFGVYNISTEKIPDKDDKPGNRIINGFTPGRNDNPYVVLLTIELPKNYRASCTGSLISRGWVVTAAHCAINATKIHVQLGIFNHKEGAAQTIIVSGSNNIIIHRNYVNSPLGIINDIALLRLKPKANITLKNIKPIPLACPSDGRFAGQTGQACGWGLTNATVITVPNIVQCVEMPVITNPECNLKWGILVKPKNVCTRNVNNRTACYGDSGGPLVVFRGKSRRQKLIGVTSFGSAKCSADAPNVFTRITSYISWIFQKSRVKCDSSF